MNDIDWRNICETLVKTYLKIGMEQKDGNLKGIILAEDIFISELLKAASNLQIDFYQKEINTRQG